LKNVAFCITIIIVICAISGESLLCDICTCENSIINCTETGQIDILDLEDHTEALKTVTLMYFNYKSIVHIKQLPSSKVKFLSFRHNKINTIDDYAFTNLKSLIELDLSYNCLTFDGLNPNVFKVLIFVYILLKLYYLSLYCNRVFNVQLFKLQINAHEQTSSPGSLAHLHLDYNNIHSLLPNVFKELSNLVSLTLAGNPLVVIDRTTYLALTSLPMLKVYTNNNIIINLYKNSFTYKKKIYI